MVQHTPLFAEGNLVYWERLQIVWPCTARLLDRRSRMQQALGRLGEPPLPESPLPVGVPRQGIRPSPAQGRVDDTSRAMTEPVF
jgi:hypothetical protein